MTPSPETALVDKLPTAVSLEVSLPFMLGSASLAASYGSSFFLVEALRSIGQSATTAGAVISTGTIATILSSLVAGRIADLLGLMRTITFAAAMNAAAMICFASASILPLFAYIGGLLLGIGWSVFYILAPLQVMCHVQADARIKYLTLLSGSQMLGIGLAAPPRPKRCGSHRILHCSLRSICRCMYPWYDAFGVRWEGTGASSSDQNACCTTDVQRRGKSLQVEHAIADHHDRHWGLRFRRSFHVSIALRHIASTVSRYIFFGLPGDSRLLPLRGCADNWKISP